VNEVTKDEAGAVGVVTGGEMGGDGMATPGDAAVVAADDVEEVSVLPDFPQETRTTTANSAERA
jgi:hypothetical protein